MIRRLAVLLCLAGAAGVGFAWRTSLAKPLFAAWPLDARQWIGFHVAQGRARLFLISSRDNPCSVKLHPRRNNRILVQERVAYLPAPVLEWSGDAGLGTFSRAAEIRIGPAWMMRSFGWGHDLNHRFHPQIGVSFVRLPLWFPVAGLLLVPIASVIRGPLRGRLRARRGRCISCGYDLTGLPHARCPECGWRGRRRRATLQRAWRRT